MKIAVVGAGRMGRWFTRFFLKEGYEVRVVEVDRGKYPLVEELGVKPTEDYSVVGEVDWVLLAVPIDRFEEAVKCVQPYVRGGQKVIDICSVKEKPVKIMRNLIRSGVTLGAHPLFGPGAESMKGKNVILTPVSRKEREFAEEFRRWLEEKGANVHIMPPKRHDELMSVVLCFPHFVGLVACETLLELEGYAETRMVAGSSYRMLTTLAEAVASEEPEFYATLQASLPNAKRFEKTFYRKCGEWLKIVDDREAFAKRMKSIKERLSELYPEYINSYNIMNRMLDSVQ